MNHTNDPKYYYHNRTIEKRQKSFAGSDNIALRHNYFISFSRKKELKIYEKWLEEIDKNQGNSHIQSRFTRSVQHKNLKSNLVFKQFFADTNDQMLVGFGNSHIHETSLNFHHIYGNPYIAGSMLKGICRLKALRDIRTECLTKLNNIIDELEIRLECIDKLINFTPESEKECLVENLKKESKVNNKNSADLNSDVLQIFEDYFLDIYRSKKINNEHMYAKANPSMEAFWFARLIFGNQHQAGKINFHDAFTDINFLDVTVFAPHNQDYFKEESKVPPADYQQPIPIKYLTLPKKAKFMFEISAEKNCPQIILEHACCLLKDSLKNIGVGAKTALGFGTFDSFYEISEEEIEKAKLEFTTDKQQFLHNLDKMDIDAVFIALQKPFDKEIVNKLQNILMNDSVYKKCSDKASFIKDILAYIKEGSLSELVLEKKISLIKYLETIAEGNIKSELKNYRNEINPQTDNIQKNIIKVDKESFEKIFNELKQGMHKENAPELYNSILKGLDKWKLKIKESKKTTIKNECLEAIKNLSS